MSSRQVFGLAAIVAALAMPAHARPKDTRPVLALLSVSAGQAFTQKELSTVEEVLLSALERTERFRVVGRSDMATLLDVEAQKQAAGCNDSTECMTQLAGALGADYVAAANVGRVGRVTVLALKVIEARKGNVLVHAQETVHQDAELIDAATRVARQVVHAVFGSEVGDVPPPDVRTGGPQVMKSAVTDAVGSLSIYAPKTSAKKRPLAVRLDLIDPEGTHISAGTPYENKRATLGRWTIVAQATGYEELRQTVDISPDDIEVIPLDLKKLGGLSVVGMPSGAAVAVTGPTGFHDEGGLPWQAQGLHSGPYQVKISRTGYVESDEVIEVKPGETTTLRVKLEKDSGKPKEVPVVRGTFTMTSETVFDSRTNLTWQRAVHLKDYDLAGAAAYCRSLKLAGDTGWRLPTRAELQSLVDRNLSAPTLDVEAFPETPPEQFWTSTEYGSGGAWVIDFSGDNSIADYNDVRNPNKVRCVR